MQNFGISGLVLKLNSKSYHLDDQRKNFPLIPGISPMISHFRIYKIEVQLDGEKKGKDKSLGKGAMAKDEFLKAKEKKRQWSTERALAGKQDSFVWNPFGQINLLSEWQDTSALSPLSRS